MFKFIVKRNNCEEKSYNNSIKVLALVLVFCAVIASMLLKYSVKCDFGVSSGFHLDLSPATYTVEVDPADGVIETDAHDTSLEAASAHTD